VASRLISQRRKLLSETTGKVCRQAPDPRDRIGENVRSNVRGVPYMDNDPLKKAQAGKDTNRRTIH